MFSAALRRGDDVEFLMDETEPAPMGLAGVAKRSRRAIEPDAASVGRNGACEYLDERAFAGAVLPHQRKRFARTQFERGIPQGDRAAKRLAQMGYGKKTHAVVHAATPWLSLGVPWPARLLLHVLLRDERRGHINHALLDRLAG